MVTVRKLISLLKKMPQNLEVGIAMHDNTDHEIAGWVHNVTETTDYEFGNARTPKKCVVLQC